MTYVLLSQSPSLGYVSWSNVHIVYDGVDYPIEDGLTNKKFIWFELASPTALKSADGYPELADGDTLVFMNRGGVAASLLDSDATDGGLIVPGTISSHAIATGAITADHIAVGAIQAKHLDAYSIDAEKLTVNAVTAQHVEAGAIETEKLAAGAVTAEKILAGNIEAKHIASESITTEKLVAGAITTDKLAANSVTADNLAVNSVVAGKIAANAIAAEQIQADAILASKLAIGDTSNIYPDPDFLDASLYLGDTFSLADNNYGSSKKKLTISAGDPLIEKNVHGPSFPVEAGRSYYISGKVGVENASPHAGARLLVSWFSDNDATTLISTHEVAFSASTGGRTTAQGGIFTAPANAFRARLSFQRPAHATSVSQSVFNEVIVRRAASGELIVDGSVTADKIGAGAITAAKLAVGSGNLIWNSTGHVSASGWQYSSSVTGTVAAAFAPWRLAGYGTLMIHCPGPGVVSSSSTAQASWRPDGSGIPGVAATAGVRYQAAALLQAHRADASIAIQFYNGAGAFISEVNSATVGPASHASGLLESNYTRATVLATAPPGTAYALLRVQLKGVGSADAYVFFTKVMLSETTANATEVGAWQAGGVTKVEGGMIETRTIQADRIAVNAITANELAANSVTVGKIAAGAVRADQIFGGEIRAVHLASDTIITQAAQMGTAVVGTAAIGDLSVNRLKVAGSSVTTLDQVSNYHGTALNDYREIARVNFTTPSDPYYGGVTNVLWQMDLSGFWIPNTGIGEDPSQSAVIVYLGHYNTGIETALGYQFNQGALVGLTNGQSYTIIVRVVRTGGNYSIQSEGWVNLAVFRSYR